MAEHNCKGSVGYLLVLTGKATLIVAAVTKQTDRETKAAQDVK